jgi:alkylhydroperoxidase/carboxymuconolactone decarboxylase family protein YurZ
MAEQAGSALAQQLPEAAGGYDRIRRRLERDGALPAATLALLIASAAAVRGADELAAAEIARARELGAEEEQIAVCVAALLLSRGEVASARLLDAAGSLGGIDGARPASELSGEEYFLRYNGTDELPSRMRRLMELEPDVFAGYHAMHHAVLSSDPRTDALAELVLCAINAAELQTGFIAIHAASARRRGVSDAQLIEAALCAVPVAGVGAWAAAAAALFPDG